MRISDWSSDVCSSDLPDLHPVGPGSPIPHGKPEVHIFSHGHVLEKRIMLKNEADVPIGDLEIRHVFAIEGHLAGNRKFKYDNEAEMGRAHVCNQVTNANIICSLLLGKNKKKDK